MNNFLNHLTQLRRLTPDADFARRTRLKVLGTERSSRNAFFSLQIKQAVFLSLAMGMALIILFAARLVSQVHLDGFSPNLIASLNSRALHQEQQAINFNIKLAEAKYYESATAQVTMALKTVFDNESALLDTESIKKQAQDLDTLVKKLAL